MEFSKTHKNVRNKQGQEKNFLKKLMLQRMTRSILKF